MPADEQRRDERRQRTVAAGRPGSAGRVRGPGDEKRDGKRDDRRDGPRGGVIRRFISGETLYEHARRFTRSSRLRRALGITD